MIVVVVAVAVAVFFAFVICQMRTNVNFVPKCELGTDNNVRA